MTLVVSLLCAGAVAAPWPGLGLGAEAGADALLVGSSGEHLWIAREGPDRAAGRFDLLHHALEMRGPYAAATVPLNAPPEALAAVGDRVWVVTQAAAGRSVLTLRVRHRPELALYVTEPEGRFVLLDMLPGDDVLAGFTATAAGPAALLERIDPVTAFVTRRLLELRGDRWTSSPLPPAAQGTLFRGAMLATDGPDLARLNLFIPDPDDPALTLMFRREAGRAWTSEPAALDLDLRAARSLTSVRGRLAAILHDDATEAIEIAYLRPGAVLRAAGVDARDLRGARWAIAGMHDGFRMIVDRPERDAPLAMRTIHWLTGEVGPDEEMTRPPLPTGRLWHLVLMLTVAVVAVLLVLLVRPGSGAASASGSPAAKGGEAVALPKRTAVLSPVSRLIALFLDLVPGGILGVLILRVPPIELLRLPIMTHSLDQAAPYLLMILITFAHSTLTEVIKGTTLGKALVGGRVISLDGRKPSPWQALARNALKLLILMIPPLAIFALLSRHLQGFNDLLARTVVIGDLPDKEQA